MHEEQLENDRLIMKWKPILDEIGIPKKHLFKLAEYCEHHLLMESGAAGSMSFSPLDEHRKLFPSTFGQSLRVLSKLDLDKVEFVRGPIFVIIENDKEKCLTTNTYQVSIEITNEQAMDLDMMLGIDVLANIETILVEEMTTTLQEKIKDLEKIYFYMVIADIKKIPKAGEKPRIERVAAISRYYGKPINVSIEDL